MKTYHSMEEALPSLIKGGYHVCIVKEILFAVYTLEQLLICGERESAVIILETKQDACAAEEIYHLHAHTPEAQEQIQTDSEAWLKTVYITDDAGNGFVCFQRDPLRAEK